MKGIDEIEKLLSQVFEQENLIFASLSSPRTSKSFSNVSLRALVIKGKPCFQITKNDREKAFHENLSQEECLDWLRTHFSDFKQIFLFTSDCDYHLLINKKGLLTILKKPPTKSSLSAGHNRQKKYLLAEGSPVPFLHHLGIMNADGKVISSKMDKFRQINRFLEMVDDLLPSFHPSQPLNVVDFGCGKAALTFALFYYLKNVKQYPVTMQGVDLKEDVIKKCRELTNRLGYQEDLQFTQGNINSFQSLGKVDFVVSLHACDTATDAALEKAVRWEAQAILSVPCCQHELLEQIEQNALSPLLKHGILKERFAALATDAARAQLLDILGYQTQVLEFIDLEHTAKNLLIRAVKSTHSKARQKSAWEAYLKFKHHLHISPSLENRFRSELAQI